MKKILFMIVVLAIMFVVGCEDKPYNHYLLASGTISDLDYNGRLSAQFKFEDGTVIRVGWYHSDQGQNIKIGQEGSLYRICKDGNYACTSCRYLWEVKD